MKAEDYQERTLKVNGWSVNLSSYRAGGVFRCKADNVSPGACLARAQGSTREEAEAKALERARKLLARTQRRQV